MRKKRVSVSIRSAGLKAGKLQCLLEFGAKLQKMIEILEIDANILLGKEAGDTEKQESFQEVLYRIQKMQWKEQKIIMQTIDSLIDSFNEYR